MKIGFWGAGTMGSCLACNLLKQGLDVVIYSRSAEKALSLAKEGPKGSGTDKRLDLVPCDVLFTCLALPEHVRAGFLNEGSLYDGMPEGSVHVECSTIDPALAKELASAAQMRGIGYVQSTLGKTPQAASAAAEPMFVGGGENAVKKVWSLLETIGRPVNVHSVAASCAVKLISNLVGMTNLAVLAEGLRLGRTAGLDMKQLLELLTDTGARSFQMDVRGPWIAGSDFSPRFALTLAHKDLRLGTDMAHKWKESVPLFDAARMLFSAAETQGLGDEDCAAVMKLNEHDS